MAFEFKLPELGENIEQADIVKVLVKVGDSVEVDQILLEIETDKATVEVPAEKSGTVKSVNAKDGDTVKVGSVIFTFDEENGTESIQETPKEEPKLEVVEPKAEVKKEENKQNEEQQSGGIIEFKLPELGENIESADVTKVLVKADDKVEKDQVLLEIETDKATVEVPAEFSGVVKEVKIKEGEKAKVGSVVLVIESGKSTAKQETTIEKPAKTVESVKEEKITTPKPDVTKQLVTPNESVDVARKKSFATKIAPAAPTVRRFAREIGVDINEVSGSGPAGRISIDDVKKFAKSFNEKLRSGGAGMPIGIKREALPDFSKWGKINKEPMSNVRKKTAEHLSYAWATIPHVTQFDKADITDIENLRKQFAKKAEVAGGKLTVTAILLKVIAAALKVFPQFNASVDMDNKEIIFKNYFNIGVAVDTEKGLIVPVIKDVDKKNILQLSAELAEISTKARDKKITLEDLQGGCFSISNLGGIGGTAFTPIVNSPEVAILGVSRGSFEQVYKNGEFVPRMMLPLSLSYDHRIIDGADAARFIRWVVNALEQPFLLTLEG
ncbi:MAG: dihydrolipoyllysine-residue acetyltransferase [Ignavibacteriales bacterium]|nr:dihydrolipoyllysine-residue acetyltransferase [Ignavibacteriales bacterium]